MGESIDIPESDSLISAAWFGDGRLSDGSIFVSPNPIAVSSAVKSLTRKLCMRSLSGLKQRPAFHKAYLSPSSVAKAKTEREDSSSSLGILSPNTFADSLCKGRAFNGRSVLGTSRQLIQDDFLDLGVESDVNVDQCELEELVASFESSACVNDGSLIVNDGKATYAERNFSDPERTLKAAQQFCTPTSHLQRQSSTSKGSVVKITDTVYKRKKPKLVQFAQPKSKPQLPLSCEDSLSDTSVISGIDVYPFMFMYSIFPQESQNYLVRKRLQIPTKNLYAVAVLTYNVLISGSDSRLRICFPLTDNFAKLAMLKEAEDSLFPVGQNFTFETNSDLNYGRPQKHSDSGSASGFLGPKFDFMDHLSEGGEPPFMRPTISGLPEKTKSCHDENREDDQEKYCSENDFQEKADRIPDSMSLAGTKKMSESPPNTMVSVESQETQQPQHSEIQDEQGTLAISTWLSGVEPSSKLELSPWARNLLDSTGPNNATMLAEWILKSNESLAARLNPSGKAASKSALGNASDSPKEKKPLTVNTAVSSSGSLLESQPKRPIPSSVVQLEAGKHCLSFGCLNVGERAYCSVPLRCREGCGPVRCRVQLRRASEGFKIESMESGCLLLFNAGETQQLTASFCPQSVGFHSGKIVFVVEPTGEQFKICLNGWGGRAYVSVTDSGAGCLFGNTRAWTLKLFSLSEDRFSGTFCLRNGGQLPAFVKIVPYRDSQFREPTNDQLISIQPSKFVLCPGEREKAKVLLTTTSEPNSDPIFLGIFWGEEVLRRNLRAAQIRKEKIYYVHGVNFGELFDGEVRCPISASHFTRCDEGGLFNMGLQMFTIRVVSEVSKLDSTVSFAAMDVNDTCFR
ncbi:hypothetical protein M514_05099 [Trichuris suis]|uniref:Uncharacterized protein n=1 Tax=Trichuris suis TaxID=68888 RepID=A0A085NCP4_9BILA|nr:hypothetical protein M514_05099 [Trichuris suis]